MFFSSTMLFPLFSSTLLFSSTFPIPFPSTLSFLPPFLPGTLLSHPPPCISSTPTPSPSPSSPSLFLPPSSFPFPSPSPTPTSTSGYPTTTTPLTFLATRRAHSALTPSPLFSKTPLISSSDWKLYPVNANSGNTSRSTSNGPAASSKASARAMLAGMALRVGENCRSAMRILFGGVGVVGLVVGGLLDGGRGGGSRWERHY